MSDYDEIFRQYLIISGGSQDQDEIQNADAFIKEFQESEECVHWVIDTFVGINNANVRIQQLILIGKWCRFFMDDLPAEVYTAFIQLLFTQSNHEAFRENENYNNKLGDSQLFFMWRSYPDRWQSFWGDFFENFDNSYNLNFLSSFTKFVSSDVLDGRDNMIYNNIKNAMRASEYDLFITQFVIQMMGEGEKEAFEIFLTLCKWVNVTYLTAPDPISYVKQGLQHKDYARFSLDILSCLLKRGIQDDIKFSLIQDLEIAEQISNLVQDESSDQQIIKSAASLVNSAGEFVINLNVDPFIELALEFLMCEDNDVSTIVFPFLIQVCKKHPNYSTVILQKTLERLELCFGNNSEVSDESDVSIYLDQLSQLSNAAMRSNRSDNFREMLSLWDDGSLLESNPNLAVSVIKVVSDNLLDGDPEDVAKDFVPQFNKILSVEPPIDSTFAFGVNRFIKFFISVGKKFSNDRRLTSYIFKRLSDFSLLDNENVEDEHFHANISNTLNQFLKKLVSNIDFDSEIIYKFIITLDGQLVSAAGCLIRNLKSNQGDVFEECMGKLQEALGEVEQDQQIPFLHVILSFIKSLKYDPQDSNAPHVQYVHEFLEQIFEYCLDNDPLFANFIRTASSSLGDNSFDIIMACAEKIDIGEQSCSAFCDVIQQMLNSEMEKDEWVGQILESLYEMIVQKFKSVQIWEGADTPTSEANKIILEMTCSYINLFTASLKNAPQFIGQDIYVAMKSFIFELLSEHFEISNLFEICINALCQIINNDIDSIFNDGFVKCAVFFLYTDQFNPLIRKWANVCRKVYSFHKNLIIKDREIGNDRAGEAIASSLADFIDDSMPNKEEIIGRYFQIFELDRPRDQDAAVVDYYDDFKKVLVSQGLINL